MSGTLRMATAAALTTISLNEILIPASAVSSVICLRSLTSSEASTGTVRKKCGIVRVLSAMRRAMVRRIWDRVTGASSWPVEDGGLGAEGGGRTAVDGLGR